MAMLNLIAEKEDENVRIDLFISERAPQLSRNMVQKLAINGLVFRENVRKSQENKAISKNAKVHEGDVITVIVPDPEPMEAQAQNIPIDIVMEDSDIIVVNKPKGMVVHPAAGNPDGTLVNALLHHCGSTLSGIGGTLRPGIVHRIDKETSGLLIVAKNDAAHQFLATQLENHTLYREYEALVCGSIRDDSGVIDAPLGRSTKDRKKIAICADGKRAVTHYTVLARYEGYTHVRCRLETGRTHQIRVHLASIGHPVAGDEIYGNKGDKSGIKGQCLHARRLNFVHPTTHVLMMVESKLPPYFQAFLDKLARQEG